MSPSEWLNAALQVIALAVAIILPMIDWPPPNRKRRKPRKRK